VRSQCAFRSKANAAKFHSIGSEIFRGRVSAESLRRVPSRCAPRGSPLTEVVIRTLVEPGLYRDGARPLHRPGHALLHCETIIPVPQKRGAAPTFEDVAEAYMAEQRIRRRQWRRR
jgi:hypothetical protein